MNWDAIGAIGQLLGALAVVITLGYLAVQVRVARSTAADTNRLTRAVGVREALLAAMNNVDLIETLVGAYGAETYFKDLAAKFSLSINQAARADMYNLHWFWLHWGQFSSAKNRDDVIELSRHIRTFYATPIVRYSWDKSPFGRSLLDPRFVEFADGLLAAHQS